MEKSVRFQISCRLDNPRDVLSLDAVVVLANCV